MKKEEKYNVNEFWKLNGNKVIHCANKEQAEMLLKVFRRMESAEKVAFTKYGYTYMSKSYKLKDEGETCFDNMEHDFDLEYYQSNGNYEIHEFDDVDFSEYLTKEELKAMKNSLKKENGELELGK